MYEPKCNQVKFWYKGLKKFLIEFCSQGISINFLELSLRQTLLLWAPEEDLWTVAHKSLTLPPWNSTSKTSSEKLIYVRFRSFLQFWQNIWKLFRVIAQFYFTPNEAKLDYLSTENECTDCVVRYQLAYNFGLQEVKKFHRNLSNAWNY